MQPRSQRRSSLRLRRRRDVHMHAGGLKHGEFICMADSGRLLCFSRRPPLTAGPTHTARPLSHTHTAGPFPHAAANPHGGSPFSLSVEGAVSDFHSVRLLCVLVVIPLLRSERCGKYNTLLLNPSWPCGHGRRRAAADQILSDSSSKQVVCPCPCLLNDLQDRERGGCLLCFRACLAI